MTPTERQLNLFGWTEKHRKTKPTVPDKLYKGPPAPAYPHDFGWPGPPMCEKEANWRKYHLANPRVYEYFKVRTTDAINHGHHKMGMHWVKETFRWIESTIWVNYTDSFKISNDHTPYYARLWVQDHPQYRYFFDLHKLRDIPWGPHGPAPKP